MRAGGSGARSECSPTGPVSQPGNHDHAHTDRDHSQTAMIPEALVGLEHFSHAEILFQFDRIPEAWVERRSRRPRLVAHRGS